MIEGFGRVRHLDASGTHSIVDRTHSIAEGTHSIADARIVCDLDACAHASGAHSVVDRTHSVVDAAVPIHSYRCTCVAGFANGMCGYDFIVDPGPAIGLGFYGAMGAITLQMWRQSPVTS